MGRDTSSEINVFKVSAESWNRWTHLEVSALRLQPVVDKALRISGEIQHELSLGLQLVNGLNGFVDLDRIKAKEEMSQFQAIQKGIIKWTMGDTGKRVF